MNINSKGKLAFLCVLVLLELTLLGHPLALNIYAQAKGTKIKCGDVLDAEFAYDNDYQDFFIDMAAGDRLLVSGKVVGEHLNFQFSFYGPTGQLIFDDFNNRRSAPSYDSGILSARGTYALRASPDNPGAYTLFVSCALHDGSQIKAGDKTPNPTKQPGNTNAATFSGVGFPGLPPVDFSNVAKIPLTIGTPITGAVTPKGGEILGYTLDAKAGDKIQLSYKRLSGNLNVGLVVLSADNKVVFLAGLVTSDTFATTLTLPTPGQYTIGLFRIDLMQPDKPAPTAFQVEVATN
ncbi:MAG: hypothetical protein ABI947_07090 [Chloroflexota bacterium]